ncbi:MAG TPA: hypothetical protein VGA20_03560 [Gemmatimonadales bacterium]
MCSSRRDSSPPSASAPRHPKPSSLAGLGIAGGAPGINAVVEGDLPGGYDVIVLANLDPPAAQRIAGLVRGWLGARG